MIDLFKVGFLSVTLLDIVDIGIVTFLIYKLYQLLRGTIAAQIFLGLVIVLLLSFTAQLVNLKGLSWLLKFITDIWIIAFIILFQPEIRRLLVFVAKSPFLRFGAKSVNTEVPSIIADAAFEMAQMQHGALMVVIRSSGIRGFSETGELVNSKITKNMLRSIFYPRAPLHDGAVIIKNDIIEAVRATLPLSTTTQINGETLGMRHRAGLGISEQADVISIIVSEETGGISIADNGILTRGLSKEALRNRLASVYREKSKFSGKSTWNPLPREK